jgi:hypothetical protein
MRRDFEHTPHPHWNGKRPTRGPRRHHQRSLLPRRYPENQRRYSLLLAAAATTLPAEHLRVLSALVGSRHATAVLADVVATYDEVLALLVVDDGQRPAWGNSERNVRRILTELADIGWITIADIHRPGYWPICSYRFQVPDQWADVWHEIVRNAERKAAHTSAANRAARRDAAPVRPAAPLPPPVEPTERAAGWGAPGARRAADTARQALRRRNPPGRAP